MRISLISACPYANFIPLEKIMAQFSQIIKTKEGRKKKWEKKIHSFNSVLINFDARLDILNDRMNKTVLPETWQRTWLDGIVFKMSIPVPEVKTGRWIANHDFLHVAGDSSKLLHLLLQLLHAGLVSQALHYVAPIFGLTAKLQHLAFQKTEKKNCLHHIWNRYFTPLISTWTFPLGEG